MIYQFFSLLIYDKKTLVVLGYNVPSLTTSTTDEKALPDFGDPKNKLGKNTIRVTRY